MLEIPASIKQTITRYNMLPRGGAVVAGVSGGADSVCLLHILLHLCAAHALTLVAVHVNHGIRGAEADADARFVADLCAGLGVELDTYTYDVPAEAQRRRMTLEETGRLLRYQSFAQSLDKRGADGVIAVAHNENDNAETVLMRVFRGTGLKGLAGIPPVRGNIIRPLLFTPRAQIEAFCHENAIPYRTDSTNLERVYTRNAVRLELLPFAEEHISAGALHNVSRMSRIVAEEDQYLDMLASDALNRCASDGDSLSIPSLCAYPDVMRRRILRLFLLRHTADNHDISFAHVAAALDLLHKQTASSVSLPFGLRLTRVYDRLTVAAAPTAAAGFCYNLAPDVPTRIPEAGLTVTASRKKPENYLENCCTKLFSYDKMNGSLQIRSRKPGDQIYVAGMGGRKKLKDYFIDAKIPRAARDLTPLLVCGDEVVWIMDAADIISDRFTPGNQSVLYIRKERT